MSQDASFGQLVREERRSYDLTQEELARRVGCAAITVRKIEAGDLRPSQQIAERLAMALTIPRDERAEFVRLARAVQPGGRPPEPPATPQVVLEDVGQADLSGQAIRGYKLGQRLGAGSFGAVYRAVQPLVEREVAIKIILPQFANHPDFIRRFEAEAQLVARLEHPHIVPLYDYWREPGVAYLVMRLLRGGSLQDSLRQGALPLDLLARLLDQVCAALHAAHRAGVVHRDLKPSNILLDEDGNAYLADFGIAKDLGAPDLEAETLDARLASTAAYISPEQALAEPARIQTDVYSLGVMLYELLTGAKPFMGPTPVQVVRQHLYAPMPPLSAKREGLPAAFDAIIARATAKDPDERYPDVDLLLADFRQVMDTGRLAGDSAARVSGADEVANPYKGLRPFEEADAPDFFGREALTQQLLTRLSEGGDLARFLAVVGPSGSGKSSVVKAGLIPALRRGGLPCSEDWFVVEMLPGPHPLEELEAALLRVAVNPPTSLLAQLREDQRGLLRAVQRTLPADGATELVLVIDQFEELFTLVEDEAERAHLLDSLVTAVLDERSRVRVLVTLRADFIDRPLRYVDFGELLRQRSELVLSLTPDEMERAVAGPAERIGLHLEAGLTEAILGDVADQPGALPLLQYALTELFEKRTDHLLTKDAYQAIGGVRGALGRRAEEVYQALDVEGQAIARQIFLRLVTLGEGTEDVRRRVLRSELAALHFEQSGDAALDAVIDAFGKSRLLTFDRDLQTRGPTVEVAHEALLREWPRLRRWLDDSRADVRLQRILGNSTAEWLAAKRDASYLLRGSRLQQFEAWAKGTSLALTADERAYLNASLEERQKKEIRERRARAVLRVVQGVAAVAGVIAIVFAIVATQQRQEALRQASIGLAAQAVAELQGTSPERAVLIALEALQNYPYTPQAESALAQAVEEHKPYADFATDNYDRPGPVEWSPDGKQLATGNTGRGEVIVIWDAATYRELNRLLQPAGSDEFCAVADTAWSPVDQRLAVVYGAWGISAVCSQPAIWDLRTNTSVLTLTHPVSDATSVDWSRDGGRILTSHIDGAARIWDARQGTPLLVLSGHTAAVQDAAWSPTADRVVTASQDRTARVWDAKTGRELITLTGHADAVTAVSWSPDGKYVATASADGTGRVWDATSGEVMFVLAGHTKGLLDVAWSSDGEMIVTNSTDATARIWDATNGTLLFVLRGVDPWYSTVAWSPVGKRLAITGYLFPRVWDLSQKSLRLFGHTDWVHDAHWSPDGTRIATSSWDGTARIWDAISGEELHVLPHPSSVFFFTWSPDGKQIATSNFDGFSRVWDVETGKLLLEKQAEFGAYPASEGWSPDGSRIATAIDLGPAVVWDATTGETLTTAGDGSCLLHSPTWSPHGDRFVTGCMFTDSPDDNTPAYIWDGQTGQLLMALESHDGETVQATWSPDGARLAVTYEKGPVKIWDAVTGTELLTFGGHAKIAWDSAWSPDGKRIASSDDVGNVMVWDASTGQQIMSFNEPGGGLSLEYSPDGRYLLGPGGNNTAFVKRVWQSTDELIQYANECCVLRELTPAERQQFGLPLR